MSSAEGDRPVLRSYRQGDFDVLCRLDRLCFPEAIAYDPEEIAAALADPGACAFVAESGREVVAFILACLQRPLLGHIITIDVHPDFRRRGLGQGLMELVEKWLRQHGATRIVLEVAKDNEAAIALYEGRGYAQRRLLAGYYRDRSDAYLMEKLL